VSVKSIGKEYVTIGKRVFIN